jgi:hypothetical protein
MTRLDHDGVVRRLHSIRADRVAPGVDARNIATLACASCARRSAAGGSGSTRWRSRLWGWRCRSSPQRAPAARGSRASGAPPRGSSTSCCSSCRSWRSPPAPRRSPLTASAACSSTCSRSPSRARRSAGQVPGPERGALRVHHAGAWACAPLILAWKGGARAREHALARGALVPPRLGMLSVGMLISAGAPASVAVGTAIFVWLTLVFVTDLALMAGAIALRLRIEVALRVSLINPLQVFKMWSLHAVDASLDVLGPAGLYATRSTGGRSTRSSRRAWRVDRGYERCIIAHIAHGVRGDGVRRVRSACLVLAPAPRRPARGAPGAGRVCRVRDANQRGPVLKCPAHRA